MNRQIQIIFRFSTTFLILVLASISICYVLEIFQGAEARELALKTIKIVGIVLIASILIMFVSNQSSLSD